MMGQMLQGMMQMLMQMQMMMRAFSHGSQGGFSPAMHPGFGNGGGNLGGGSTPSSDRGGSSFNPCQNFLGSSSQGAHHGRSSVTENQGCSAVQNGSGIEPVDQKGQWAANLPPALRQHADSFARHGQKYGVDPKFLAAISMLETGKGSSRAFRNKNNAMGISNARGPIAFSSVDASIERMARVLAKPKGPYAGKHTIGQIARVYCPVGAGNDVNGTNHHWPRMVSRFYAQLGGDPAVAVK
jgi:hypothetical protein